MLRFHTAAPESVRIPSNRIIHCIDRIERSQVPLHSFLLLRGDRLITECYFSPCQKGDLHRMFSITKSLTGIAIGLLAEEGKLSVDDPIISYFPDKVPADVHPLIAKMTIRDLLMMRSCHDKTTYKFDMTKDWVESFFTTTPSHPAGTIFHYDTSAAHTLCALTERLSGMDMLDYLKVKLAPIGLSEESYLLKDPFGVSLGGSGLVATSEDLLRIGFFLLKKGCIDGRQLVDQNYLAQATSLLTPTFSTSGVPMGRRGYGYQIWHGQGENDFFCYGMGGQFVIVLPDYDLVCVTTADTQGMNGGNQVIFDALYEELLPYIDREACDITAEAEESFLQYLYSRTLYRPEGATFSPLTESIRGKTYRIDAPKYFEEITFTFEPDPNKNPSNGGVGHLHFLSNGVRQQIDFGLGTHVCGIFPKYGYHYAATGVWLEEETLLIRISLIDSLVGNALIQCHFCGDRLTVFLQKYAENALAEYTGHLIGYTE